MFLWALMILGITVLAFSPQFVLAVWRQILVIFVGRVLSLGSKNEGHYSQKLWKSILT